MQLRRRISRKRVRGLPARYVFFHNLISIGFSIKQTFAVTVISYQPICQYNEDCPPHQLCDRLNRLCINPCNRDSCGDNAECIPEKHAISCRCLSGFDGNPYIECERSKLFLFKVINRKGEESF